MAGRRCRGDCGPRQGPLRRDAPLLGRDDRGYTPRLSRRPAPGKVGGNSAADHAA